MCLIAVNSVDIQAIEPVYSIVEKSEYQQIDELYNMNVIQFRNNILKYSLQFSNARTSEADAIAVADQTLETAVGQRESKDSSENVTDTSNNFIYTEGKEIDTSQIEFQLGDLIQNVQEQTGLSVQEIYKLYEIQGNKPIYDTINPDITAEKTVSGFDTAFQIDGVEQQYNVRYSLYYCPDVNIKRPSKYYLPDAAYNVQNTVQEYLKKWKNLDRQSDQQYQLLQDEVKQKLYFYEAVLDYIGEPQENLYVLYKAIIDGKIVNSFDVYTEINGEQVFQEWVVQTMLTHGYSQRQIEILQILWEDDTYILYSESLQDIVQDYYYPFEYDEQTIDNLMTVCQQLVGKVRYVWGGGHYRANDIVGISPMWQLFNQYYMDSGHSQYCIMPSYTWCPIHGESSDTENACIGASGDTFNSVQAYIKSRSKFLNTQILENGKYTEMISNAGVNGTIIGHNLDGLDCSGYVGWIYNQVTGGKITDSTARYFIQSNKKWFQELQVSDSLKPGDIFQWQTHIVMIVGPQRQSDNCKVYVMVEMQPYFVQFGVAYKNGAQYKDIQTAKQIARDANELFGGSSCSKYQIHSYNIETEVVTNVDELTGVETTVEQDRTDMKLGRYNNFSDTKTKVDQASMFGIERQYSGKSLYNMNASEILQYTIDKYLYNRDEQYISGLDTYSGRIFSLDLYNFNLDESTDSIKDE